MRKISQNINGEKTWKQKTKEPQINIRQMVVFLMVTLYGTITTIGSILVIYIVLGELNWMHVLWISINLILDIFAYVVMMILRSVAPELVTDNSILTVFQQFFKRIVDILIESKLFPEKYDRDYLMSLFEQNIVWSVREWDVLYQDQLAEAIAYYKTKTGKTVENNFIETVEHLNVIIPQIDKTKLETKQEQNKGIQ